MDHIKKQPKGLYVLFFTELCDRLTYYGIQSILILYLTKYLHLSDANAYSIYGVYCALAFSTPIIGGYIGDKFIGYINAVIYGLVLMITANFFFLIPHLHLLFIGIAFVVCGIGFFKANNTSLLGQLYAEHDIRKEGGFTIFYMGMNVGAVLGPIIYGFIAAKWGWHHAFVVGAISSVACLIVFIICLKLFTPLKCGVIKISYKVILSSIAALIVINRLLAYSYLFGYLLFIVGVTTLIALYFICKSYDNSQKRKIVLVVILNIFSIFYFACSLQVSSSLLLFIDRYVNTAILGFHIPTAAFASLSSFFVILSAPLLAPLWTYLEKSHHTPTLLTRIAMGLFLASLGFLIFSFSTRVGIYHNINFPLLGIIFGNFILGAGELCIAPPLLAAVTYLIPQKLQATFMGLWYLSIAFAAYLSSFLAKLSVAATIHNEFNNDNIYGHAFNETALIAFVAAITTLVFFKSLKKLQDI